NGFVTYRFKDYHKGGACGVKKLPVLTFIDRLVQHLPESTFGRFATMVCWRRRRGPVLWQRPVSF
ncbi:MAG TPA: hypothetical protein EYH34_01795, partial [Planctomycetes bacterium]|nr:hypothetical protein [Planctomycetota bacterium]